MSTERDSANRTVLKGMQWQCRDCGRVYRKVRSRCVPPKCPDCGSGRDVAYWLLWYQTADGIVHNTNAVAEMQMVRKILSQEPR